MNGMSAKLRNLGIGVNDDWLLQCTNFLQKQSERPLVGDDLLKQVYLQYLNTDLNQAGAGVLPQDCGNLHQTMLKGQYVLQVDRMLNVSEPQKNSDRKGNSRIAKLSVTDGVQRVFALEFQPCPSLPDIREDKKAFKIAVRNVQVRRGVLLLVPDSFRVLGGAVSLQEDLSVAADSVSSGVGSCSGNGVCRGSVGGGNGGCSSASSGCSSVSGRVGSSAADGNSGLDFKHNNQHDSIPALESCSSFPISTAASSSFGSVPCSSSFGSSGSKNSNPTFSASSTLTTRYPNNNNNNYNANNNYNNSNSSNNSLGTRSVNNPGQSAPFSSTLTSASFNNSSYSTSASVPTVATKPFSESTVSPTLSAQDPPSPPSSPLLLVRPKKKPSRLKASKQDSPASSVALASSCSSVQPAFTHNYGCNSVCVSSSFSTLSNAGIAAISSSEMFFTPPSRCSYAASSSSSSMTASASRSCFESSHISSSSCPPALGGTSFYTQTAASTTTAPLPSSSSSFQNEQGPVRVAAKKQRSMLDFMNGKLKPEFFTASGQSLHPAQASFPQSFSTELSHLLAPQSPPPPLEPDTQFAGNTSVPILSSADNAISIIHQPSSFTSQSSGTSQSVAQTKTLSSSFYNKASVTFQPPPRNPTTKDTPTTPPTPVSSSTFSFDSLVDDPLDFDFPLPTEVFRLSEQEPAVGALFSSLPSSSAVSPPSQASESRLFDPSSSLSSMLEKEAKADPQLNVPKKKITVLGSSKGFTIRRPDTGLGAEAWQYLDQFDSQSLRVKAIVSNTLGFSFEGPEYELTVMLDDGTAARAARLANDLVASLLECTCLELNIMSEDDRNNRLEKLEESLPLLEGIMTLVPGNPYPLVTKLESVTRTHGLALLRRLKRIIT